MNPFDRRRFLKGAAGAGLLAAAGPRAFGRSSDDRLRLAVIGHIYNAGHFFSSIHSYEDVELVAICDPEEKKIADVWKEWEKKVQAGDKAAAYYKRLLDHKPATYSDFRKMFEAETIDAVVVSVYDHLHGPICGAAMRAGKHVFSERPLGLRIREARALRELAAKQKVATSIRNPGNSYPVFRRGVELIREGAIGPVEDVHVWFPRAGAALTERPQGEQPVPEGLNWEAWLGPVAARPYHPKWMSYSEWRETSNGGIGSFGTHAANLAYMSLRLRDLWDRPGATIKVKAEVPDINRLSFPKWEIITWQAPARGDQPPVRFTWHRGPEKTLAPGSREKLEKLLAERGLPKERFDAVFKEAGLLILGRDGAVVADSHNANVLFLPEEKFKEAAKGGPKKLSPSKGHYKDWLLACRGGEAPWASFDYAGPFSEFLMLGNIATQFDTELEYDPVAGKIVNSPEADRLLGTEYRKGWTL
jgi:hypothetical protein